MEETPALGPVYAECVDLSVMISKYPHDPNVMNFREPQNANDRVRAEPPNYKKQNTPELAAMINDMELAGFKLGNVMTVMGDRNGSRGGMFACFDIVSFTSLAPCCDILFTQYAKLGQLIAETVADSLLGRRTTR